MEPCGCSWNRPGEQCSAGYVLFKHAWELHQCIVGPGFFDLDHEGQERLWDEYERWVGRYAAHIGEPIPGKEEEG